MFKRIERLNLVIGLLDLLLLAILIYDFGFEEYRLFSKLNTVVLPLDVLLLLGLNTFKYRKAKFEREIRAVTLPIIVVLSILLIAELLMIVTHFEQSLVLTFYKNRRLIEYGLLLYFFIRLSLLIRAIYKIYFNPAVLFIGSFALIAFFGTFLLLLPNATTTHISFTDAFFTATSAISVNGLMVMQIGEDFTLFGQSILMTLFQIGGLGMLTFTTFFAYFFKSGSSVKESLFVRDILGNDDLNGILATTMKIVVFSLVVEAVGALLIFNTIDESTPTEHGIFFAVYHAISAYCNAGFTLTSDSLQGEGLRFNYYLHWILMALVVFGGLGFNIANNFVQYIKQFFINIFYKKKKKALSRLITLNTRIVVWTTLILIVGGAIFFMISEWDTKTIAHESYFGKITTAMFSSITARTAGFNTYDYANFTVPGLLVTMFLMWVGASPGSTGGGIKTTTFALATLNIFSVSRNKSNIEFGTRRVDYDTVRRAFAIIIISIIAISAGILILLILNPQFTFLQIAFECIGAYSTTGLSMGITPELTETSKYVVMFLMFFGRIGLINLMIGILKKVSTQEYKYPKESIFIN